MVVCITRSFLLFILFYSLPLFCSLNCFIFFHVSLWVGRGSFSVIHRLEYHFTCLFNVQRRCQHLHFVGSFFFFSTWCFCPFYSKRQSIERSFWQCFAIVQCTHVRCSDGEPHLFINITQSNRFISHCQQL